MEVTGQNYAPAAVPLGKNPWYSLNMRLGGAQGQSGPCGEGIYLLSRSQFNTSLWYSANLGLRLPDSIAMIK
jgi:hypothetical protein